MTGLLVGLSCGALIGWAARVARERSRFRRIRDEIMDEIRRQDRTKLKAIDRFNAERLMRLADEEFERRHGE